MGAHSVERERKGGGKEEREGGCGVSLTCDEVLNGCYEGLSIPGSHQVGFGLERNDLIITPQTDNVAHTVLTQGSQER